MLKVGTRVRLKDKVAETYSRSRMGKKPIWIGRCGVIDHISKRGIALVIWDGRTSFDPVPLNALVEE